MRDLLDATARHAAAYLESLPERPVEAKLGSEAACRSAAKLHVEGKDYVMRDGDTAHFRFNV